MLSGHALTDGCTHAPGSLCLGHSGGALGGLNIMSGGSPLRVGHPCDSQEWSPLIPVQGRRCIINPCCGKWVMLILWSEGTPLYRAEIPKAWSPPRASVPTGNVGWVQILGPTPELLSQKTGGGVGVAPCVLAGFQGDTDAGHLQTPGVVPSLSHLTCKQGQCCGFSKEKPHTWLVLRHHQINFYGSAMA